jgi:hypothetical protein
MHYHMDMVKGLADRDQGHMEATYGRSCARTISHNSLGHRHGIHIQFVDSAKFVALRGRVLNASIAIDANRHEQLAVWRKKQGAPAVPAVTRQLIGD